ncbi:hypothetical protein [Haloarcula marina]|uniref:hypothetical protein n=1 Tax=Haloarcula marina TaxID=2961574 RepID=UPI0020B7509C|nr:hypothetical protein [Halomicroarcula marina]
MTNFELCRWLLVALAIVGLVFALAGRDADRSEERPLSVLRERYARGERSDGEFERRGEQLERVG